MSKTIVNLSLSMVSEELDKILNADSTLLPLHTLSLPLHTLSGVDLRQKLTTYVLSRIPGQYAVLEDEEISHLNPSALCTETEHLYQIKLLIHQGLEQALILEQESVEWAAFQGNGKADGSHLVVPEQKSTDDSPTPSSWFG